MPKKYFFYCIGLLVLAIAGIYGYTKWTEAKEKVDLWTLVPADAVLVVESQDHARLIDKFRQMDLWDNIATLHSVEMVSENIALLDSLASRNNRVSRFLRRKTILSSVHVVSKTNFDFVFYIPVNTVGEHRFVRSLVENINKSELFSEKTQEYQQYQITTIKSQANNETFSYFSYHNNLIVSANPELIKEIIRNINRGQLESPAAEFKNINYLDQPEVFAHVFINYRHVPQLASVFLKDTLQKDVAFLASLCRNSMLGFKEQNGEFLINGFSNPETLAGSFYNHLKQQKPQTFEIKNYLPARTALFFHVGAEQTGSIRKINAADKNPEWTETQLATADSLTQTFRGETGFAFLETDKDRTSSEKVIFVRSVNPNQTNNLLQALTGAEAGRKRLERIANFSIRQIPVPDLPIMLFGSVAGDYPECFVSQVDNYFIFGPDANTLRSVINDIKAGRVWAKAENQKLFLEHTQQESNFSLYFNTTLAWNMLSRYVREKQRSSLLRHETLFKKLNQVALQFSWQDGQYYTTFLISHPDPAKQINIIPETLSAQVLDSFPSDLITPPLVTQNKSTPGLEYWLQDTNFNLYRIGAAGKRTWTDTLRGPLIGPVYQAVFGGDAKPKFIYATAGNIFSSQQNGQPVDNFPFNLPDSVLARHLSVLKLNQTNQQHLLIDDQAGNIFMFDVAGNLMPGWAPKHLEGPLVAPPQHLTVNGKDAILVLQQNGYVYAYNGRGELYTGFPLALGSALASEAFIKAGNSPRNTTFTVVTQRGQVVTFSLSGRISQRKQLPRGSSVAQFQIIPDAENKSYILMRQEPGKVSLYDQNLKLLLERNFITSSKKIVQYFDFGPLNRVYVLTETGPGKTYLYNYQAKPLSQPLDNKLSIDLKFTESTNSYWLYRAYNRQFSRILVKAL